MSRHAQCGMLSTDGHAMSLTRRALLTGSLALLGPPLACSAGAQAKPSITVYKTPT